MLIALGVCGGIGAYKAVEVVRGLQKRGDVAQVRPPPWLPAKCAFFLMMVCGRIARSTVLESISIRPSLRKRSRAMRLDVA